MQGLPGSRLLRPEGLPCPPRCHLLPSRVAAVLGAGSPIHLPLLSARSCSVPPSDGPLPGPSENLPTGRHCPQSPVSPTATTTGCAGPQSCGRAGPAPLLPSSYQRGSWLWLGGPGQAPPLFRPCPALGYRTSQGCRTQWREEGLALACWPRPTATTRATWPPGGTLGAQKAPAQIVDIWWSMSSILGT